MKAQLQMAGLGEKRFAIPVDYNSPQLHEHILCEFPKLRDGGGYEVLRGIEGGGRELQEISIPPGGYTVEYLKAVVDSAKIFI